MKSPGFDEESVLTLVDELHGANPHKRTFTAMEIGQALGWAESDSDMFAAATAVGQEGEVLQPRQLMPRWMEVLNQILQKHGEQDKLAVATVAVVVFPVGARPGSGTDRETGRSQPRGGAVPG